MSSDLRPAELCAGLLRAMEASEGRRRRRPRDTTPDAIGFAMKRALLERAVEADPAPDDFEAWLLARCHSSDEDMGTAPGPVRAVAKDVFDEWLLARAAPDFRGWLERGARSEDADPST